MGKPAPAPKPRVSKATVERVVDEVHVITDKVVIPIDQAERVDVDRAFKLIERLRAECIDAAEVDMSLVEDEKVVIAFDFSMRNGNVIVRVTQVAE